MPDQARLDPFNLRRFVAAQDNDRTFDRALAELRRGAKESHWMWFIFPQLAGLGRTAKAATFGITGRAEAEAYLAHRLLGPRLVQCAEAALQIQAGSAEQIFADDARKLRSSATLFAQLSPAGSVFHQLLSTYYHDVPDKLTIDLLQKDS